VNPAPAPWDQRRLAVPVCAVICVICMCVYAGPGLVEVAYRLLTDGVFLLLWLVAAYGIGSLVPMGAAGALRLVTKVAIGLGAMSLLTLALGLSGVLNRAIAFALVGAGVALSLARLLRGRDAISNRLREWWHGRAGWGWLWALVMPLLAIALVGALVPPGVLWGDEPNGYDVVEYHLQVPREWYEAGHITALHHNVFSFFPFNVEMHYLLAMHLRGGPWAGMYLAQLMHVGFVALSVVAVLAVARSLGGNGTIAGVCAAATPWLALLAPVAYNEGGLLLYGTLATGWTLLALRDPEQRIAAMAIAGAMTGLAAGVKLTAVPMLLLPLPVALVVIAAARRQVVGRAILAAVGFGIVATLVFAPWCARNVAWAGNPVFPEGQSVFGRAHFTEAQSERWKAAHSPRADQQSVAARCAAAWEQIAIDARYGYLLIPLAIACAALAYRRPETWLLAALLLLLTVFWLGFTHLQGRFFVLAVPVAALLIAQVRGRALLATGAAAALLAVIGFAVVHPRASAYLHEKHLNQVLGIEAIDEFMIPPVAKDAPADATLVLVGDAKAFCYRRAMSRLRYRTVFDVDGGDNWLTAWRGEPAGDRTIVLIDPAELARFGRTYRNLPLVPTDVLNHPEPYLTQP
jgi:hypothetical protein